MQAFTYLRSFAARTLVAAAATLVMMGYLTVATRAQDDTPTAAHHSQNIHMSSMFAGVKANTGTVTHMKEGKTHILTLSDDFKVPDSPAPHWQVVDSKGNVYLLNRLQIKGDKFNKTIRVPSYVKDVAKVQIWCAWAEVLLGEASFPEPLK